MVIQKLLYLNKPFSKLDVVLRLELLLKLELKEQVNRQYRVFFA